MKGSIQKVREREEEKMRMWNKKFEPGQDVYVIDDEKKWHETRTISPAFLFQNHTAMVRVEAKDGVEGDWDLEYVMAKETSRRPSALKGEGGKERD